MKLALILGTAASFGLAVPAIAQTTDAVGTPPAEASSPTTPPGTDPLAAPPADAAGNHADLHQGHDKKKHRKTKKGARDATVAPADGATPSSGNAVPPPQ